MRAVITGLMPRSAASGGSWLDSVGLLWPTGVEPAGNETIFFPLQGGNHVWYVDFNAGSNGNGSSGSPYWSLTELNNGTASGYAAGDHIYVTGDATAAKSNPGTRDMRLTVTNASRVGTTTNPTVVRSWPGQSRAKFDGSYTAPVGFNFDPSTNDGTRGVVIINIEVTRCDTTGNVVLGAGSNSAGIAYQRIISCYIHHNISISGGPNSNYGGAYMVAKGTACDIKAYNNQTNDNIFNASSVESTDNNTGGLSLLSEQDATGSVVEFYNNLQYNEHFAIRHKHDGAVTFRSYHNYAYNCDHHHYLRVSALNTIHHCIFRDGRQSYSAFIVQEAENQAAIRTVNAYNNTLVRVPSFCSDGDTNFSFNDILNAHENIHYQPSASYEVVILGYYSGRNYYTAGASFDNNNFYGGNTTNFWMNNGTSKTRAQFDSQFGTDNIYTDPLFTNTAGNDFTLQAGSPCRNINGTGLTAGAL